MKRNAKKLWLSWEWQRRSVELSKALGAKLLILEYDGLFRYPVLAYRTIRALRNSNPDILMVQNPSMVLAFIGCLYSRIFRKIIVVDRHSNFMLSGDRYNMLYRALFNFLNALTVRMADITVVTNRYIADIIESLGGKAFVLPDKMPNLNFTRIYKLKGKFNVLLISSFGKDEPIGEVLKAMSYLTNEDIFLYVTGNYRRVGKKIVNNAPANTIFTGFLPEQEFVNMLFSVDAVMVLTTIENCMLCGCYEAYAALKPLITSNTRVLREYFRGAIFVNNSPEEIRNAILLARKDFSMGRENVRVHKKLIEKKWNEMFLQLQMEISKKASKMIC